MAGKLPREYSPFKTIVDLKNPPHYVLEDSNFNFRYARLYEIDILREKMVELFANSEDPNQTPRSAASDLGLHCLPITLLGVSRLQWVDI